MSKNEKSLWLGWSAVWPSPAKPSTQSMLCHVFFFFVSLYLRLNFTPFIALCRCRAFTVELLAAAAVVERSNSVHVRAPENRESTARAHLATTLDATAQTGETGVS